ncbi:hypothetical protein [Dyadobacter psychrophilus]|uniref:SH3 domain-containing protein n=1 Tax=Dyadobacter psychrophilus TaxID=651661 RepID=A0A1T5HDE6_9BACT|nr:hypothetical protein [Dyadobacter psychrophilus]SKC18713.1 hypothetical protein SAMN05660293_05361 [Dyadobacter psychrophilus]
MKTIFIFVRIMERLPAKTHSLSNMKVCYVAIVCTWLLISCSSGDQQKNGSIAEDQKPGEELLGISQDEVFLLKTPKDKTSKIINQKATEALHETHYISVDKSVKVKVLEKENGWSKVQVVEPDWLQDTHIGWIEDNYLSNFEALNPTRGTPIKLTAFASIEPLRTSLSSNGIGQLHSWKHVDGGDWQSITDYFEIGQESNDYGLRNNLAYYLTSSEESFAESLELVLNINVPSEGEYASKQMKTLVNKTFKSLNQPIPSGLLKSVSRQSRFTFENERMTVTLKPEKSRIMTLILEINTK